MHETGQDHGATPASRCDPADDGSASAKPAAASTAPPPPFAAANPAAERFKQNMAELAEIFEEFFRGLEDAS